MKNKIKPIDRTIPGSTFQETKDKYLKLISLPPKPGAYQVWVYQELIADPIRWVDKRIVNKDDFIYFKNEPGKRVIFYWYLKGKKL